MPVEPLHRRTPLALLEGHDHDSVINLAFSATTLTIPEDVRRVAFNERRAIDLVGLWHSDHIHPVTPNQVLDFPVANLGDFFSNYLNTVFTIIHQDGRIFHYTSLRAEGSNDPRRYDATLQRVRAFFGPDNPTKNSYFVYYVSRL